MIKYLYYFVISLALVFIQQSVLPALGLLVNLNILLVFIVFITIISGFNLGFVFAIMIGFLYNLYSFLPFGTFIFIYLLVITLVNFLYKQVLTNFSFVTNLILIILATILYAFLTALAAFILCLLGVIRVYIVLNEIFFFNFLWQIIMNLFLISLIFIIAKLTMKKLNLVFILKK